MAMKLVHKFYSMLAIVTMLLSQRATAQSGCTSSIMSLAPCLGYIQGSSSNPTSSCCTQLGSVVQSNPRCLCSMLNGGGSQFGISINQTKALSLPSACNVQTPPISRCNGGGQPGGTSAAPIGSPIGSPNSSPADAMSPADGSFNPKTSATTNSKTVPSTNGSTSDGNTIFRMPLHLTIFLLFITSIYASTFKI